MRAIYVSIVLCSMTGIIGCGSQSESNESAAAEANKLRKIVEANAAQSKTLRDEIAALDARLDDTIATINEHKEFVDQLRRERENADRQHDDASQLDEKLQQDIRATAAKAEERLRRARWALLTSSEKEEVERIRGQLQSTGLTELRGLDFQFACIGRGAPFLRKEIETRVGGGDRLPEKYGLSVEKARDDLNLSTEQTLQVLYQDGPQRAEVVALLRMIKDKKPLSNGVIGRMRDFPFVVDYFIKQFDDGLE